MPTVKRIITQTIKSEIKVEKVINCCEPFKDKLRNSNYPLTLSYGYLRLSGDESLICPFCGEKVIYDDTVILPEGYERKLP